jgi:hypothetical protein
MTRSVRLHNRRCTGLLGIVGLLLVLPILLSACSTSKTPSSSAVGELNKVAPVKRGEAALVFVYTDG